MKTNANDSTSGFGFIHKDTLALEFGLTKREYFAGLAMQCIRVNGNIIPPAEDVAIWSVRMADALIEELNKR